MAILTEDFEGADEWQEIRLNSGSGTRFEFSTNRAHGGSWSGHQPAIGSQGNDPDGGYRLFPGGEVSRGAKGGIRAEWWWYRAAGDGGAQMRAGLLNSDLNGYTLAVDTDDEFLEGELSVRIEKRTGGQVDQIMDALKYGTTRIHLDVWRRSVFELKATGEFIGYVYAADGTLMHQVEAAADVLHRRVQLGRIGLGGGTFETFDRFAAVGGVRWNIDDLTVDYINP